MNSLKTVQSAIALLALSAGLLGLASPGHAQASAKLGISIDNNQTQAGVDSMGPKAWYWGWRPSTTLNLHGREFVPCLWDGSYVTPKNIALAKTYSNTLLTFNEPNHTDQSNMTPAQALAKWPTIEKYASGMRIGAPQASDDLLASNSWLDQFLSGIQSRGYKEPDFMCVHAYPDAGTPADPVGAANGLITYLKNVHAKYNMPIWVTELALPPWGSPNNAADNLVFMKTVLPQLESLPFVERYSWWVLNYPYQGYIIGLTNNDGSLTDLGSYYKTFGEIPDGSHTLAPQSAPWAALDASGWGDANGTPIDIWGANGQGNQSWTFTNLGNSIYKISPSYDAGMSLDNTAGGGSGTLTELWQSNSGLNQQWHGVMSNGGYTFSPLSAPDSVLDAYGAAEGDSVGIWTTKFSSNQIWAVQ